MKLLIALQEHAGGPPARPANACLKTIIIKAAGKYPAAFIMTILNGG